VYGHNHLHIIDNSFRQTLKKVREPSSRLLTLTAANESYRSSWNKSSPSNETSKSTRNISSKAQSIGNRSNRLSDDLRSLSNPRYKYAGANRLNPDDITLNVSMLPRARKGSFSSTISTNTGCTDWNSSLDALNTIDHKEGLYHPSTI